MGQKARSESWWHLMPDDLGGPLLLFVVAKFRGLLGERHRYAAPMPPENSVRFSGGRFFAKRTWTLPSQQIMHVGSYFRRHIHPFQTLGGGCRVQNRVRIPVSPGLAQDAEFDSLHVVQIQIHHCKIECEIQHRRPLETFRVDVVGSRKSSASVKRFSWFETHGFEPPLQACGRAGGRGNPPMPRNISSGHDSGQTNSTARIQRQETAA